MRLIDADALYIRVKTECNPYGKPTLDFESGKKVLSMIDRMPTIEPRCEVCEAFNKTRLLIPQPQRKKGKWLLQDGYRCSFCNYKLQITGIPNTCPNCGAEMEGQE